MPLLQVFGERVETLCAMGPGARMLPEFNWGDTVIALCKLPSGRMFQLQIDIFSYRPVRCGYFLQGTQGCFEYDRAAVVSGGKLSDWKSVDQLEQEYQLTNRKTKSSVSEANIEADYGGHRSAFELCVRDFMAAIENDTQPPLDLYDALHITAIGWAIDESLKKGNAAEVISFEDA